MGRPRPLVALVGLVLLAAGCTAIRPQPAARAIGGGAAPPAVSTCYDSPIATHSMWAAGVPEVPCTGPHLAETYYTGTSPGPGSSAHVRPGSPEMFGLFATCEEYAREFLGAAWHSGWVQIQLTLPRADRSVSAAERRFSCEAFEVDQLGPENPVRRTSSLRGALVARGPLSMGCLSLRDRPAKAQLVAAGCDQPHEAEYVSSGHQADPPDSLDQGQIDLVGDRRCAGAVSSYTRSHQRVLVGFAGWGPAYWMVGQVTLRCFALAPAGKRFTASVKALGDREPPTV